MVKTFGTLLDPSGKKWHMRSEERNTGSFGERFVQVFPEKLMELAADPTLKASALRVYAWALANLSFERWQQLRQVEVADELTISASAVGQALAALEARGFLERRGAGPRQEWRVTPKAAWMGTAARYQAELRRRAQGFEVVEGGRAKNEALDRADRPVPVGMAPVLEGALDDDD